MRKYPLILIVVISIFFSGCSTKKGNNTVFTGNLEGETTNISAENTGKVIDIKAEEGSSIKAGDVVYVLDDTMLRLQKSQIESQIDGLEVQLKIAKDKGNKDNEKLAQYNVDAMKKSLEMVEENIKRCKVTSPVDGIITSENLKKGEIALQGAQLFNVMDNSKYYLKIYVPEKYLSKFNVNNNTEVYITSQSNKHVTGKIIKIDTTGQFTPKNVVTEEEKSNIVYGVMIGLNSVENIKPGMIAEVRLSE